MSTQTVDRSAEEAMIESPLAHLSEEKIEELGREFDAIHDEIYADLGDRDRRYIKSMIEMHRRLALQIKDDWHRNGRIVRRTRIAFEIALILLIFEILAWLFSIAGGTM